MISIFSGTEKKSDVVTESKIGLKLINFVWSINYKFWTYFSMNLLGRDSFRLDPASSIQEQKLYTVKRTLLLSKSDTVLLTFSNTIFKI